MTATTVTNADAILLACSGLALPRQGGIRALGPKGWSSLRDRAREGGLEPRDLVHLSADGLQARLGIDPQRSAQLAGLFARHGQLAMELERLSRLGIWTMTLGDDGHPPLLLERLGDGAPPVLFGLGDRGLLGLDGLAVVGSRDADDVSLETARLAGEQAARQGWALVSGAARGVDATAMRGAFEAEGSVIGIPADGLERHLKDPSIRAAAREGRVVYVSPYGPSTPFSAGTAMGRNKLIYCLSRVALVVSATAGSGGTWAGAVEALENGWVPVYVVAEGGASLGNAELVRRGANAVVPSDFSQLDRLAERHRPASAASAPRDPVQQTLF
jgi:predicted Rossmann fold nucleotide-binding protein DprA/Smf involved in DNA uptake